MKKFLKIFLLLVFVGLVYWIFFSGENLEKKFSYLKYPQISEYGKHNMIVVELKGDPGVSGKKAFSALFKTFYKIKSKEKGVELSAPKARWPQDLSIPKEEWTGIYGIRILASIKTLPEKTDPIIKIQEWEYGKVAEILHVGEYSQEAPAIEKLRGFIKEKGYKIIGDHEEEYIKGPGMFFAGDPKKYLTIIRYRIEDPKAPKQKQTPKKKTK